MQPRRERRLTAEGSNLAEQLQECFLCQVLGFGGVRGHTKTKRVNAPLMPLIKGLKRLGVSLLGPFNGFGLIEFACLSSSRLIVGQAAFSGRIPSDAANYLCVVWLAGIAPSTSVISTFKISEHFYRSLDSAGRRFLVGTPLHPQG
jgi:hypothetical protein